MKLTKRSLIWLTTGILIVGMTGCDRIFRSPGYSVQRVSDGDTLTVRDTKNQQINVRFACMDAPEVPHSNKERQSRRASDRNQFKWGNQARERVQQLVDQAGDRVVLNVTDSDRYGRKVAEIRLPNGTFVQEVLLREGLAKVYRPYLNKCPSRNIVQQAESEAQQRRRGVWSDSRFVNPWEYRSLGRKSK